MNLIPFAILCIYFIIKWRLNVWYNDKINEIMLEGFKDTKLDELKPGDTLDINVKELERLSRSSERVSLFLFISFIILQIGGLILWLTLH